MHIATLIYLNSYAVRHNSFQYPFTRVKDSDMLQDIHDGRAMMDLMSSGNFLSVPEHTGLILCTDGVPVFKSSKGSIWPVYLMVTSIPPEHRFKVDNMIVASLWFGPTKPNMYCLLNPILESIVAIRDKGILVQSHSHSVHYLRPKLIMAVFDLPARAAATNMKQFNGEHGCLYCLDKGQIHNRARIYPPNDSHTLRTNDNMRKMALEADATKKVKFGIKGSSVLSNHLHIPECIPIDYMHSVLEGVFKQLMKLWFGPSFRSEPFSLRKHMPEINQLIKSIKPPNEVQRLPRSVDDISLYKASEYRAWLLFYVIPILSHFLPADYIHHLSLLVSSLHILLSDKIKIFDLNIAYQMLSTFYQSAGQLYNDNIYTANLHSLEHTVSVVQLWGPLWSYSMFSFENLNGYLGRTFHGTQKIVCQMSFNIQLRQILPDKLQELSKTELLEAQSYLHNILDNHHRSNMHKFTENCYAIGKLTLHTLTAEEQKVISECGIILPSFQVQKLKRIMIKGVIFYSSVPGISCSRNNTICSYKLPTSREIGYGKIQSIFLQGEFAFLLVTPFLTPYEKAPIHNLRPSRIKDINDVNYWSKIKNQIVYVEKSTQQNEIVIPVSNIISKCIYINIPIRGKHAEYIIQCPNTYEVH